MMAVIVDYTFKMCFQHSIDYSTDGPPKLHEAQGNLLPPYSPSRRVWMR